jgi:hypothetical protein
MIELMCQCANMPMCQCANMPICQWGNVPMGQWGNENAQIQLTIKN